MGSPAKGGKGGKRSASSPPVGNSRDDGYGDARPAARRAASPAATKGRAPAVERGAPQTAGKGRTGRSSSPAPSAKGKGKDSKGKGKGGSQTRASSAPPARDWTDPEGWALEAVSIGAELDGVVTNVGLSGVFIDVGAERNARLSAGLRDQRKFKRGDHVIGMVVETLDLDLRRMGVTVEDIDKALSGSRRPMEDFEEGTTVDGVIADKGPYGVFINVGCIKDAKLNVPARIGRQFVRGQVVRGLYIDNLDLELRRLGVSLDDAEASAADFTLVSLKTASPPGGGRARAKAKAKAKVKAQPKPEIEVPEHIQEGGFCDGVVVSVTNRDVIVDIEDGLQGNLRVSAELRAEFQPGDRVQGMKVEKAGPRGIVLSMEDPELEVEEEARLKAKGAGKGKGKGKAKMKASANR